MLKVGVIVFLKLMSRYLKYLKYNDRLNDK